MKQRRINQRKRITFPGRQLLLLCLFCCVWQTGWSQEDTIVTETVIDTNTIVEPPPVQEEDDNYGVHEEKGNNFLYRSVQTNGGGPGPVDVRAVPDSTMSRLLKDDDFWYVNEVFEKRKEQVKDSRSMPGWVNTLLWVVIIGSFAAFLVWFLASSDINVFRKSSKAITAAEEDETIPEDIFQIQYEKEIDKAVRNGNYRLAVRLHYLQLLKKMADRQIITYKHDSTNFDYITQLYKTRYYNDFFRITRHYEYSWYGHFDVSPVMYEAIQADVINFNKLLN